MRWISTGMATAARPARNNGVRKAIKPGTRDEPRTTNHDPRTTSSSSPYSHQTFAARQIAEESAIQRLGRIQQRVVDPMFRKFGRQGPDVGGDNAGTPPR